MRDASRAPSPYIQDSTKPGPGILLGFRGKDELAVFYLRLHLQLGGGREEDGWMMLHTVHVVVLVGGVCGVNMEKVGRDFFFPSRRRLESPIQSV